MLEVALNNMATKYKKNPAKMRRNATIAQDHLNGLNYSKIAKKHGIDKSTVYRALNKVEMKEVIDQGTSQIIALIPKAVDVHLKAMENKENPALALKASETILKTGAIVPGNTVNQTINNIYKQTNNLITDKTVNLVKKILPGFQVDEQEIVDIPA